jgi:hypothetical protein
MVHLQRSFHQQFIWLSFFSKEKKDNFVFLLKQKNKGCLSKNSQKQNITRGKFTLRCQTKKLVKKRSTTRG